MKRALLLLPLVLLCGMKTTAQATPIVVSAGQTVTFNFDFVASGAIPAPPYTSIDFRTNTTVIDNTDVDLWTIFDGLNGTGSSVGPFGPFLGGVSGGVPGALDGVFSVVVTLTKGDAITVNPAAAGFNAARVSTGFISPLQPQAVPEPASMMLLGTGLIGFGARRWRNMQAYVESAKD